jgi:hypothetical protein
MARRKETQVIIKQVMALSVNVITLLLVAALASCTSKDKTEPKATTSQQASSLSSAGGDSTVGAYAPGEAGGVASRVIKASATVTEIDPKTRHISLSTDDGSRATFAAPPEMHNFDQLRVGDKVNATLKEQILVSVGPGTKPSDTHAAAVARAPKGARPGAMAAETFQAIATVKAIDSAKRTATLQFADGDAATVPVRKDVDLTRYKVGDSVLIRITQQLTVLTERP